MSKNLQQFKGLGVAVVTPFDANHAIDYKSLEKVLQHQLDGGVDYFVIHGSTGEAATLSAQERRESLDFVLNYVKGQVPIVVGLGSNSTVETVKTIRSFNMDRIDGILVASPSYNKPTQEGIYQHFKSIAEATDLPIILYNVPGRTASNMAAETTLRLARDFSHVVAIKEASGDLSQVIDILKDKPNDFMVISGDDLLLIAMVAYGAQGLISVLGNAYPHAVASVTRLALEGDLAGARQKQFDLVEITKWIFQEGNPAGIKEILSQMNLCEANLRLPLTPVSQYLQNSIKKEMAQLHSRIIA